MAPYVGATLALRPSTTIAYAATPVGSSILSMPGDDDKGSPPPSAAEIGAMFQKMMLRLNGMAKDVAAILSIVVHVDELERYMPPPLLPPETPAEGFPYGMPGYGSTILGGSSSSAGSSTSTAAMMMSIGVTT